MKTVCVIPARLASTRFPRKMLAPLKGKPLIEWVFKKAKQVPLFQEVVVATDSEEIQNLITSLGGKAYLTSPSCLCGTDRLVELQQKGILKADIWVNWQGDEPFVDEKLIEDLLQSVQVHDADLWTLKKRITKTEEITSPHTPKVVCDEKGYALYFSRSTIPYYRSQVPPVYFKHIGMYAFTEDALSRIPHLKPSPLEEAEQLEQLRFLSGQMKIKVHETAYEVVGIDLPEHLKEAESFVTEKMYKKLF